MNPKRSQMKLLSWIQIISLAVTLISLQSCKKWFAPKDEVKVLATVGNTKLTSKQLELSIPQNLSKIDSISFAQTYIENWVKEQLFLEKARENLDPATEETINIMLNGYETSLYIYKYQQRLLQQKLDTLITDDQISEYYAQHAGSFKLDSNVVRAIFIQLPKSAHDAQNVRNWMRSHTENDLINLEDYCYQNARNFNLGENWTYFNRIMRLVPGGNISNAENFLKNTGFHESQDSLYKYFIQVIEYRLVNDTAPLEFVQQNIKDILLNHRQTNYINTLKNNLYQEGISKKRFTIYTN